MNKRKLIAFMLVLFLATLACADNNSNNASVEAIVVNDGTNAEDGETEATEDNPVVDVEIVQIQEDGSEGDASVFVYPQMPTRWQELDLVFEPILEMQIGSFELWEGGNRWENHTEAYAAGYIRYNTFLEVHTSEGTVYYFMCLETYEDLWGQTHCRAHSIGVAIGE